MTEFLPSCKDGCRISSLHPTECFSLFHFHLLSLSGVAKEPGLKVGQKEKGQDVRRHSSYIFPFPVLYVSTSIHFPVVAVTNYQHHKL